MLKKINLVNFFLFFSILFFNYEIFSDELFINCKLKNNVTGISNIKNFVKKIDTFKKKIVYQKGILFDKIVHYGENAIIFNNDIYENYSVYDINYNIWTTYTKTTISIFRCYSKKTP
tara:strand:- start:115 stop:465 length:351 start_codon:yes stop_codon:yes gene_type:complete